jgi:diaminopimelate epimerase
MRKRYQLGEKFLKYHHLGNDFIFFDVRKKKIFLNKKFIERICDRNSGVGADGVILLEESKKFDYRMRIFNSDGSEAEACGNGVLCFLKFLEDLSIWDFKKSVFIEIMEGVIEGRKEGGKYLGIFKRPKILEKRVVLDVEGENLELVFLSVFVPHVVLFVEGLKGLDVKSLGRKIRYHGYFSKGVNVNFVECSREGVFVRVYERGVERETLSCGTGALAVAEALRISGKVKEDRSLFLSFKMGEMEVGFLKEKAFIGGVPEFVYMGENFSC